MSEKPHKIDIKKFINLNLPEEQRSVTIKMPKENSTPSSKDSPKKDNSFSVKGRKTIYIDTEPQEESLQRKGRFKPNLEGAKMIYVDYEARKIPGKSQENLKGRKVIYLNPKPRRRRRRRG
jgi:hypothetical protein